MKQYTDYRVHSPSLQRAGTVVIMKVKHTRCILATRNVVTSFVTRSDRVRGALKLWGETRYRNDPDIRARVA